MSSLNVIEPDWPAPSRVRAAFTLRSGGVSEGPCASLNLGRHVGDDPAAVDANRSRVRAALGLPTEPAWLEQVHGHTVADLDHARTEEASPFKADAAVTRESGPVCAIQVADCMPVLFAAQDGTAIGAAHAGWRGLAGGVLEQTVSALQTKPSKLLAWMGPAISQTHFEVGEEVREAFVSHAAHAEAAFVRNNRGRWQCDLYALARARLMALGISGIYGGGWCTYTDATRFYSFRREGRCGRMAALIWMT